MLARLVFPEKTTEFSVEVNLTANLSTVNPFDFFVESYAETWPFAYPEELRMDLAAYLSSAEPGPRVAAFLQELPREAERTVFFLVDLNHELQQCIRYVIRMEAGVQTPEETLALGSGSCRDSAWLLVNIARYLAISVRRCSRTRSTFSVVIRCEKHSVARNSERTLWQGQAFSSASVRC